MKTNKDRILMESKTLTVARLLDATRNIHSMVYDFLDVNYKDYYNVPFRDILDDVLLSNRVRGNNSQLLTYIDDSDKSNYISRRLAKLLYTQFNIYRDITGNMRNESDLLSAKLMKSSKPNFKLPEIYKNEMVVAMTDTYGQYGEQFLGDNEKGHSRATFVNLPTVETINTFEDFNFGGIVSLKSFLDEVGLADFNALANYVLTYKSISTEPPTIKEALIFFIISINADKFKLGSIRNDLSILASKKIIQSIELYENTQDMIVASMSKNGGVAGNGYITLTGKKVDGLGTSFIDVVTGAWLTGLDKLDGEKIVANVDTFHSTFEAHIGRVEMETQAKYNMQLMNGVEDCVKNIFLGFSSSAISELHKTINHEDSKVVLLDALRKVNALLERDKKDSDRVIESIFLGILYKDTPFAKFYGRVSDITEEDKDNKVSSAIYYLTCELLVSSLED